ncbi:MAG: HAD-IB family hydrolase [Flavobacteriales bacterium]|nr:HAD-IB family hydrolase [Flavobacteriales bacterium]
MRPLALFDLDGTITDRDTFVAFLVHVLGRVPAYLLLLAASPMLVLARLGIVRDDAPKRFVLRMAFKGRERAELDRSAASFCRERMPGFVRPGWHDELNTLRAQDARIVVVTASCSLWVSPWCAANGIELLATELEWEADRCTGELLGENCKGLEKVKRIGSVLDTSHYRPILAYGDTKSDIPMLELADHPRWRPFR